MRKKTGLYFLISLHSVFKVIPMVVFLLSPSVMATQFEDDEKKILNTTSGLSLQDLEGMITRNEEIAAQYFDHSDPELDQFSKRILRLLQLVEFRISGLYTKKMSETQTSIKELENPRLAKRKSEEVESEGAELNEQKRARLSKQFEEEKQGSNNALELLRRYRSLEEKRRDWPEKGFAFSESKKSFAKATEFLKKNRYSKYPTLRQHFQEYLQSAEDKESWNKMLLKLTTAGLAYDNASNANERIVTLELIIGDLKQIIDKGQTSESVQAKAQIRHARIQLGVTYLDVWMITKAVQVLRDTLQYCDCEEAKNDLRFIKELIKEYRDPPRTIKKGIHQDITGSNREDLDEIGD